MAVFIKAKVKVNAVLKRKTRRSLCLHVDAKVERRNWLELPESLTLRIFTKLETPQIFVSVRQVCSHWRELAKEPILYRSVVLGSTKCFINPSTGLGTTLNFRKLIDEVVALSCGQIIQFSCGAMMGLTKHDLLYVAASSASGLKSLQLGYWQEMNSYALTKVITTIPTLEELYIAFGVIRKSSIEKIGRSCPRLRYFYCSAFLTKFDNLAFAIAKSMPGLRCLRLFGNDLTNTGMQAILDGCPNLEYLNLNSLIQYRESKYFMFSFGEVVSSCSR